MSSGLESCKMPVTLSSYRLGPGQRVSYKTVPPPWDWLLRRENELEPRRSRSQIIFAVLVPPLYVAVQAPALIVTRHECNLEKLRCNLISLARGPELVPYNLHQEGKNSNLKERDSALTSKCTNQTSKELEPQMFRMRRNSCKPGTRRERLTTKVVLRSTRLEWNPALRQMRPRTGYIQDNSGR